MQLSLVHSVMAESFPGSSVSNSSLMPHQGCFPSASVKRLGISCIVFELRQPSPDLSPPSSCLPSSVESTHVAIVSPQTILTTTTSSPFLNTESCSSSPSKDAQMADLLMELERERMMRIALEQEVQMLKRCVVQSANRCQQNVFGGRECCALQKGATTWSQTIFN